LHVMFVVVLIFELLKKLFIMKIYANSNETEILHWQNIEPWIEDF
jgi:hypothetical protein